MDNLEISLGTQDTGRKYMKHTK